MMQILDLMGYEPSPWNKVNIHIGGNYGKALPDMPSATGHLAWIPFLNLQLYPAEGIFGSKAS